MTIFSNIRSWATGAACYLSAGSLLHAITALELVLVLAIASVIGAFPLKIPFLSLLFLFPFFTQLDARSRYQEYKKVRDQLILYGPDHRIFRSVCTSRCQRDAALAAARQLEYGTDCKNYFAVAGYRWYHLLPGFIKSDPGFFFSTSFWQSTFFAPTYRARFRSPSLISSS